MALTRLAMKVRRVRNNASDPKELEFVAYSGGPVDLSDHDFDEQSVYNLETARIKNQKLKMMYNHRNVIGTTTSVTNDGKSVTGKGVISEDNKITKRIVNSADKFPYEMSLGMDVKKATVVYYPKGTRVNNRVFTQGTYVINNVLIDEVTITEEGRDSNTRMRLLNSKIEKKELLRIKNSGRKKYKLKLENALPEKKEPIKLERPKMPKKRVVNNKPEAVPMGTIMRLYNTHPYARDVIERGANNAWSLGKIKNAIKVRRLENGMGPFIQVSGKRKTSSVKELEARVVNAVAAKPEETLEKFYGKELRDRICNTPNIGIKEFLTLSARMVGESSFTGHSDASRLMNFWGKYNRNHLENGRVNNAGPFSSFDMPNLFGRVTKVVFEEAWLLKGFFAKEMCYKTSQSTFNPTERLRPKGGQVWEGLDQDGRIKHASFGKTDRYLTSMDTKAQMLMIDRETAKNDDFGAIKEILKLMVEGAMMVPDIKLVQHMLQAQGAFFKAYAADTITGSAGNGNDVTGGSAALTEAGLALAYDLASERVTNKGSVNWIDDIADNWTIVVATKAQERAAWDIVSQREYVSNTTANTKQVKDNYWYKRFNIKRFPQLANTTIKADIPPSRTPWFLMPNDPQYAPFAINWLDGVERPTVETVDAPVDCLGFGVRGYMDCDINDRESETIVRMRP